MGLVVLLLFIASGFSSLIYQVVWTRLLVFVFGSTTFATATVLAVFMGGLALGSFLAGNQADRVRRPLLAYGVLEGIIGVWALLVPSLFDASVPLYRLMWQQFHMEPLAFGLLRFLVALVVLLPPTTCMGATLPLLARHVSDSLVDVGRKIGTLYAANTLGAVAGAALAGLYLLPAIGLNQSTTIAAAINFALVIAVYLLSRFGEKKPAGPAGAIDGDTTGDAPPAQSELLSTTLLSPESTPGSSLPSTDLSPESRITIIAFGVSGALAMIYEVGWTRTLLMVIGSSTYAFTLMLTSFLLGIFLGSLACARLIDRAKEPLAWFAIAQLLVGVASLYSMNRFNYVPYWNLQLNAALPSDPNTAMAARFAIAAAILMPLTFFQGAVFPAAVKACVRDLSRVGRSVGILYSSNTLGAIVGSFCAGFILIPALGVEKSLITATALNILTGAIICLNTRSVRRPAKIFILLGAITVCGSLLSSSGIWDRQALMYAQSARRNLQRTNLPPTQEQWKEELRSKTELLFYADGASSTVGILGWPEGKKTTHSLVTNGHIDASDEKDMSSQILVSAGPIAVAPKVKDIAIIGWGSGVTIGAAASVAKGASITAIELEPEVVKSSRYFHHVNYAPETIPGVHIEMNDGRNFLLASPKTYDVIVSEPSNPWQTGVCNLFTREYFQLCKQRLNNQGVFALWSQIVEVPGENVRSVLSALHEVFPYCAVLLMNDFDLVALGSCSPISLDLDKLRANLQNKDIAKVFNQAGIDSPEALAERFVICPAGIDKFVAGAAPNIDDTNKLEYEVGRIYENSNSLNKNREMFEKQTGELSSIINWQGKSTTQMIDSMCAVARQAQLAGHGERSINWAESSLKLQPNAEAKRLLGIVAYERGDVNRASALWNESLKIDPNHVETLQTRGLVHLNAGDRQRARDDFSRVLKTQPGNKVALMRMARTYAPRMIANVMFATDSATEEQPDEIIKIVGPLLRDQEFCNTHPFVYWLYARALYKLGRSVDAFPYAAKFLQLENMNPAGVQLLAAIHTQAGDHVGASQYWKVLLSFGPQLEPHLLNQAESEIKSQRYEQARETLQAILVVSPDSAAALGRLKWLSLKKPGAAK